MNGFNKVRMLSNGGLAVRKMFAFSPWRTSSSPKYYSKFGVMQKKYIKFNCMTFSWWLQ